jgi:glycine cleavage system H lipoate-binding protein/ABC-type phosphate transport system substrate-binding protein
MKKSLEIKFNRKIMKTRMPFIYLVPILFISLVSVSAGMGSAGGQSESGREVTVTTTSELAGFVSGLTSGFNKITGKNIKMHVSSSVSGEGGIHILSGDEFSQAQSDTWWNMVIGHEIIVPVMNSGNPLLKELAVRGLTAECFSGMITSGEWPEILQHVQKSPVRVYVPDNGRIISKVNAFAGTTANDAVRLPSSGEVVLKVQNDLNAIGFCRLADAMALGGANFAERISIIPVDKNRNGKIDGFENIYSSPDELIRGVWIGKYSRKLCSNIYAVSASKPVNEETIEFLDWVLHDGQEVLASAGYSNLLTKEKTAGVLALRPPVSQPGSVRTAPFLTASWKLLISFGVIIMLVYIVAYIRRKKTVRLHSEDISMTPALNVDSIQAPAGLFYDKTHTWAFMEKSGRVKIGMNDFLQHIMGPLSQIRMKSPGEQVRKGEKMITVVREGKQLEFYSPVTGIIKMQNQSVFSNPEQVYSDPYNNGWIYEVEPLNWIRETRFMFMADKFREWLDDEFVRLKDFLAASANSNNVVYEHIVLQDGGELTDNVLADLGPEVWEDFQTHFIDISK